MPWPPPREVADSEMMTMMMSAMQSGCPTPQILRRISRDENQYEYCEESSGVGNDPYSNDSSFNQRSSRGDGSGNVSRGDAGLPLWSFARGSNAPQPPPPSSSQPGSARSHKSFCPQPRSINAMGVNARPKLKLGPNEHRSLNASAGGMGYGPILTHTTASARSDVWVRSPTQERHPPRTAQPRIAVPAADTAASSSQQQQNSPPAAASTALRPPKTAPADPSPHFVRRSAGAHLEVTNSSSFVSTPRRPPTQQQQPQQQPPPTASNEPLPPINIAAAAPAAAMENDLDAPRSALVGKLGEGKILSDEELRQLRQAAGDGGLMSPPYGRRAANVGGSFAAATEQPASFSEAALLPPQPPQAAVPIVPPLPLTAMVADQARSLAPPPKTASAAQPPPTAHALLGALASGSLTARVFTGSVPTPRLHGRQVSVQAFQPKPPPSAGTMASLLRSHEKPISLEAVFAARIADEAVRVSEGLLYPMPPSTARPSTTVPAFNTNNNAYGVVWPFGQPQQPFDPAASTTAMDEGRAVFRERLVNTPAHASQLNREPKAPPKTSGGALSARAHMKPPAPQRQLFPPPQRGAEIMRVGSPPRIKVRIPNELTAFGEVR